MSDVPPGAAGGPAPGAAGGQQPSEEEVRAYLEQLRGAPVDQVVAEVLSGLLNAAQVKLGRNDARLLIDLAASMMDTGRDQLPDQLTEQVDQVLTQLRLAQVEAEKEVAGEGGDEAPTAPSQPGQDAGTTPPPQAQQPSTGSDPSSRLWIPGR